TIQQTLLLLLAATVAARSAAQGSMNGPPVTPRDLSAYQNIVNINGQDGFYLKKDLYLTDTYTIIDGERVMGTPFLYITWLSGTLTTPDGRVYTDYTFRYNVRDQTISFLNGTDSLEVNEEIKEFTLNVKSGDSVVRTRFLSSAQVGSKGKPVYYEVMLDDANGQLLKSNEKVVASLSSGLLTTSSRKYLKLESTCYYYDKVKKKLTKIRPSTDIAALLQLSEQQAKELNISTYDLTSEEEVLRLIKAGLEKKKLKAF
ncbi:MAG: hypothetical protein ABW019_08220, partial [Chitinophagaceae bacterium]